MTAASKPEEKAAHIPGPWTVSNFALTVMAKDGQMRICDIRGWGHLTGSGAMHLPEDRAIAIQTANAHLIAAAPDMLAKLREIHGGLACSCRLEPFVDGPVPCTTCQIGQVIAKAEAGQ